MPRKIFAPIVTALLLALALPSAASEKPARGKVILRMDSTSLTMGEMCLALDGSIYTENVTRQGIEALKLAPSGDVIWRRTVFPESVSLTNSRYGACATKGALYGIHGHSLDRASKSKTRAQVVRLSAGGVIEWKREVSVAGCDTLLFAIEQDPSGQFLVGGSVENCVGVAGKRGYIARLGLDGAPLGMMFPDGLESVRHLASSPRLLVAAGRAQYGSAVLGFWPGGAQKWGRWDEQIGLSGEIEGLALGPGGIYLCGDDDETKQVQLVRIDETGKVISNWNFGNRSTPVLGECLAGSSQQHTIALVTARPNFEALEIARLGEDGVPRRMAPLLDDSEFSRGYGLSPDGQALYLGGTPKGRGPGRPFIVRYTLAEAAPVAAGVCLTAEASTQFAQRRQQVEEALRKANALQASQIEATLASRPWTPEQKAEFRANLPMVLEDMSTERAQRRKLEVVMQLREQLETAADDDCKSIEFRLGLKLESLQADADRNVKYVDRLVQRIFMLAKPASAPAAPADISHAQMQWIEAIQRKVRRNWIMPTGAAEGTRCMVEISLLPDGRIQGVRVAQSSGKEDFDNSVVAAVNAMGQLPLPELREVFHTQVRIIFAK